MSENGINASTRVYNGPRSPREDYFDDLMEKPAVEGSVFADSAGLRDYDSMRSTQTSAGILCSMHCRACGAGANIEIPWDELYAVAEFPNTGMLPANWATSEINQALYPKTACKNCQAICAPQIRPAWAHTQLSDAMLRDPAVKDQLQGSRLVQQVFAKKAARGR